MSAIKRYIESQASLIAMEHGLKVDDIVDEIMAYIVDHGFSTDDAIQTVRTNIAVAPLKLALCKACGVPIGIIEAESVTCSDDFKRYSNSEVDLREVGRASLAVPITERSANDIAEEIQESIRRRMK